MPWSRVAGAGGSWCLTLTGLWNCSGALSLTTTVLLWAAGVCEASPGRNAPNSPTPTSALRGPADMALLLFQDFSNAAQTDHIDPFFLSVFTERDLSISCQERE